MTEDNNNHDKIINNNNTKGSEDEDKYELDQDAATADEEDIDKIIADVDHEHALSDNQRKEGCFAVTKVSITTLLHWLLL